MIAHRATTAAKPSFQHSRSSCALEIGCYTILLAGAVAHEVILPTQTTQLDPDVEAQQRPLLPLVVPATVPMYGRSTQARAKWAVTGLQWFKVRNYAHVAG